MIPVFLITVDTEGDNLWARPREITTRNAEYLPRFQELCERYGLRPTYLVTYEMAISPAFREFGRDVLRRNTAEIGAHPHAWNNPPLVSLTPDDLHHQPYLFEYPEPVMEQKIRVLTQVLEDTFGVKMRSHRAGRWGFNETYARLLVRHGYLVDCSVTPHLSWRRHLGAPQGTGGPDYRRFPEDPYYVDLEDVSRPGNSTLMEVPVTVVPSGPSALRPWRERLNSVPLARRLLHRFWPSVHWLRPDRRNLPHMLRIVRRAAHEGCVHLEFMVHSSELMPGGSPLFPTREHIEHLYRDLEVLFERASRTCRPATLSEFYEMYRVQARNPLRSKGR
ncbi:MAG: deacetylase [Armatimonadota bacterium]|nr:deacetylase [Armatimonadota bacterium]MDR7443529.1 deacetylase [Armatimonadota bacterium]MDR7570362.1 deacetylase [Armatimonadota bacterium]MDR7615028.1 deacetylase [Armatimonadota bacterium]